MENGPRASRTLRDVSGVVGIERERHVKDNAAIPKAQYC